MIEWVHIGMQHGAYVFGIILMLALCALVVFLLALLLSAVAIWANGDTVDDVVKDAKMQTIERKKAREIETKWVDE